MEDVLFWKGAFYGLIFALIAYNLSFIVRDLYFYLKVERPIAINKEFLEAVEIENYEKATELKKKYSKKSWWKHNL